MDLKELLLSHRLTVEIAIRSRCKIFAVVCRYKKQGVEIVLDGENEYGYYKTEF